MRTVDFKVIRKEQFLHYSEIRTNSKINTIYLKMNCRWIIKPGKEIIQNGFVPFVDDDKAIKLKFNLIKQWDERHAMTKKTSIGLEFYRKIRLRFVAESNEFRIELYSFL